MADVFPQFNQIWIFSTNLFEVKNIKFYVNLSSCSSVDTCGQTDDGPDEANRFFFATLRTGLKMYVPWNEGLKKNGKIQKPGM
jgi:hypothetical protein